MVICKCMECGKEFKVKPYKKDTAKFCSRECVNKHKQGQKKGEWIIKICPSCGKEFESLKSRNKKYCSEKCLHERNDNYMLYNCDCCGEEIRIKKSFYQRLLDGKQKSITCSYKCMGKMKNTGRNVICKNCGKTFYRRQYHIDRHENVFCSNKCQFEYQHIEKFEIKKCEICGKEFECSKLSTQRFCSQQCNNEWQKTLIGEQSKHFISIKQKCDYCNKEIFVTPYRLKVNKHHFCNKECRQKWYAEIHSQTEEYKEKSRLRMISEMSTGKINSLDSKPQLIINSLLQKMNTKYKREYNVTYYCIDNYLSDCNLMIEIQGDYWHCNPQIYTDKIYKKQYKRILMDKSKHTYVKNNYGIEILYLWESDICNNTNLCEKLILEYIDKNGRLKNYHSFNYKIMNDSICLKDNIITPYQYMNIDEYKHLIVNVS